MSEHNIANLKTSLEPVADAIAPLILEGWEFAEITEELCSMVETRINGQLEAADEMQHKRRG